MTAAPNAFSADFRAGFRFGLKAATIYADLVAADIAKELPAEAYGISIFAERCEAKIPKIVKDILGEAS